MITKYGKKHEKFIDSFTALSALYVMTLFYAQQGVLVTSHVNLEYKRVEMKVYITKALTTPPKNYYFTQRVFYSHWYFNPITKVSEVIRTMDYIFEY